MKEKTLSDSRFPDGCKTGLHQTHIDGHLLRGAVESIRYSGPPESKKKVHQMMTVSYFGRSARDRPRFIFISSRRNVKRESPSKNKTLYKTRRVSYEMVLEKIIENDFIGPEHNPARPRQFRIIVDLNGYPHVVPLVIDEKGNWFLKTIFPSRAVKRRLKNE